MVIGHLSGTCQDDDIGVVGHIDGHSLQSLGFAQVKLTCVSSVDHERCREGTGTIYVALFHLGSRLHSHLTERHIMATIGHNVGGHQRDGYQSYVAGIYMGLGHYTIGAVAVERTLGRILALKSLIPNIVGVGTFFLLLHIRAHCHPLWQCHAEGHLFQVLGIGNAQGEPGGLLGIVSIVDKPLLHCHWREGGAETGIIDRLLLHRQPAVDIARTLCCACRTIVRCYFHIVKAQQIVACSHTGIHVERELHQLLVGVGRHQIALYQHVGKELSPG